MPVFTLNVSCVNSCEQNSLLPPSQRCREQTKKPPTGPFDRDHLINYLERHAKEQPDKADPVPYETGKVRGKKWQPPATPATPKLTALGDDAGDFDELLKQASEEELCDLAAILGMCLYSVYTHSLNYPVALKKKKVTLHSCPLIPTRTVKCKNAAAKKN